LTGALHLILVKHSLPAIEPGVAAAAWRLSPAGRARCRPLADALAPYRPDYLFASAEPKATETAMLVAAQLGLGYAVAADLHEHRRATVPWLDAADFAAQVARCFAEPAALVMGEETADQAHRRFAGAVDTLVAAHHGARWQSSPTAR
jgi:broad specificity phosphatase PhoE